ncbi:MAG: hypothetical protein ACTSVI_02430 [Promethearchaeota archaeon]
MFKKRYLKGIKGVVSAKDLEKYLENIMLLERELHSKEIKIGLLETRLNAVMKELSHSRKVIKNQEEIIQKHRSTNADLQLQLESLKDLKDDLERSRNEASSKLSGDAIKIHGLAEFQAIKADRDKLLGEVKKLGKMMTRKDVQIKKLTEENVALKDKLRYLKKSRF